MPNRLPAAVVLLAVAATTSTRAWAQHHLQPGLWEQTLSMKSSNAKTDAAMAQMNAQLASLPPEQRKMVEQAMASHGVGLGGAPDSVRLCLTKAQVESDALPRQDGQCRQQSVTRSGDTIHYTMTCQGRDGRTLTSTGDMTYAGGQAYTAHTVTDTVVEGQPAHMTADITGKWLGSDCGSIAPVAAP